MRVLGSEAIEGRAVEDVLKEYQEVFGPLAEEVKIGVRHKLEVTGRPVKQRAYRVSPKEDEFIKKEVEKLLDMKIIKPSKSPWASPVVLAGKKDGTLRFCVNYKALNDVTVKDSYPQPIIEDLLNQVAGHKYYTKLDLYSGYHQIPMNEESIEKTAFIVKQGLYEFERMPFGLTNAPASFQRAMDELFADLYGKFVTVYMDDFCIYSDTLEDHVEHLEIVLSRLRDVGLRAKKSKCKFADKRIEYLGHWVDADGIKADPNRIEVPDDLTEQDERKLIRSAKRFFVNEGEMFRRRIRGKPVRVILSLEERKRLLRQAHDGLGHFGVRTTFEFLNGEYYWPRMFEEVKAYVLICHTCQMFGRAKKESMLSAEIGVNEVFERFGIDYVGPLPETKSKKRYLIVAVEYLTGWPVVKAVKNANARTTAKFIYKNIICQYGIPKILMTDRGTHFNNEILEHLSLLLEFKHVMSAAYNPQTNGKVERMNGTLCNQLAKMAYDCEDDWSKYVDQVVFAYRIRPNEVTGKSPYELLYGIPPKLSKWVLEDLEIDWEFDKNENLKKIREYGIKSSVEIDSVFKLNDYVVLKEISTKKLQPKWKGFYRIITVGPNNSYQLGLENGKMLPNWVNGRRLQRYYA